MLHFKTFKEGGYWIGAMLSNLEFWLKTYAASSQDKEVLYIL